MNQELYEKLREMRLPIMAEEYKDQSENPSIQNMTFEETPLVWSQVETHSIIYSKN